MAKRTGGEIPLSSVERVLKRGGIKRSSEQAKQALREALEEIGRDIAGKAKMISEHAGRTTIRPEDINLVSR